LGRSRGLAGVLMTNLDFAEQLGTIAVKRSSLDHALLKNQKGWGSHECDLEVADLARVLSGPMIAEAQICAVDTPCYSLLYTYPQTSSGDTGITCRACCRRERTAICTARYKPMGVFARHRLSDDDQWRVQGDLQLLRRGSPLCFNRGYTGWRRHPGLDGNLWGQLRMAARTPPARSSGDAEGAYKLVYSFTGGNTDDGAPSYPVVQGQDGNMYGVSRKCTRPVWIFL